MIAFVKVISAAAIVIMAFWGMKKATGSIESGMVCGCIAAFAAVALAGGLE